MTNFLYRSQINRTSSTLHTPPGGLLGVAFAVSAGELLHESVNLLRLSGQSEAVQEQTQRRHEVALVEVQTVHVRVHHLSDDGGGGGGSEGG